MHIMHRLIACYSLLLLVQNGPLTDACNMLVTDTQFGKVSGSARTSIVGDEFCSFKGMPYAKPPIGELRFRDPLPPEPWSGVRESVNHSRVCPQYNLMSKRTEGDEDCLYLNVYTRDIAPVEPRPVMVWIHGGAFLIGSGDDSIYGADYFMRKNVVIVTVNYRLGIFGFLNLEDQNAPGNQGFKDQVLALKWVQQNIANFGGDPERVTIFGESAGAASVHYLTLSPLSKGLFHRAIIQSGVAVNPWARKLPSPTHMVYRICAALGNNSRDHYEIMEFLRSVDSDKLVLKQGQILTNEEELQAIIPFGPSIDSESENPFMAIDPTLAASKGIAVPLVIGHTSREGILMLLKTGRDFKRFNSDFEQYVHPYTVKLMKDAYNLTCEELKYFYYGEREVTFENKARLADLVGDVYFVEGTHKVLKTQISKSSAPTYFYRYSYDKGLSLIKKLTRSHISGAAHADDLASLFRMNFLEKMGMKALKNGTDDYALMERMIDMWTNFANSGNPTPHKTTLMPFLWEPVTGGESLNYLDLNKKVRMSSVINLERVYGLAKSFLQTKLNLTNSITHLSGI